MTELTLRPLATASESELAALQREAFADYEVSAQLAAVLASEAAARRDGPAPEARRSRFGLAAFEDERLVGWTQGYREGTNQFPD